MKKTNQFVINRESVNKGCWNVVFSSLGDLGIVEGHLAFVGVGLKPTQRVYKRSGVPTQTFPGRWRMWRGRQNLCVIFHDVGRLTDFVTVYHHICG